MLLCSSSIDSNVGAHSDSGALTVRNAHWGEANITTLDGVRVDYPTGWGLVRASNTTPVLVLRFEAESEDELKRIQEVFRAQLYTVAPDLTLPF